MLTNLTASPTQPPTRSRRRVIAAAAVVIAVGSLLGVSLAAVPVVSAATAPLAGLPAGSGTASPCPLATQPPLAVTRPGQAPPANTLLRLLADRLRATPADQQAGGYAYAALRMQAADSTFDGPCVTTVTAYADEQRWRADDGAGLVIGTAWHHDPAAPPPADATSYPAGGLAGVVPGPVPTDAVALAAALDAVYPPADAAALADLRPVRAAENIMCRRHTGTAARLRAVADLNAWHYTNRAARRAVLLVLADVAGLTYRGGVAGYPDAIAVSADSGDWRDLLVIDVRSGVILAYEQVLVRNGHLLGVHTPYSNVRTVYDARGRSSQPGLPPSPAIGPH